MRHSNNVRKFGREKNQRHALMRSLARNLIRDGRIKTTGAKAKELRPYVEKLVTVAKNALAENKEATVASRRLIQSRLMGESETKKLFDSIAPKYSDRAGGYTRIVKLPNRDLDNAPMSIIEFV